MSYVYEGVTCDGEGTPRGKRVHRIVCDEDGEHTEGTCRTLLGHRYYCATVSIQEAGPEYANLPLCKVCHPKERTAK